ncbi:high mobility group B protein 7-like isoform X1 [Aristolochia californica]|uniref:high mobility group B protein 7-like isoform X1 n=1 Tax=Aristolochia californica TaxID=171875 RepID=UPI0035D671C3
MAPSKSNPPRTRKRVEVEASSLKRAKDGSGFTRCEACNKDVAVGLIDMHSCSLDSMIKMNLEAQVVEKVTEVEKPPAESKKKSASSEPKKGNKEKKVKEPNKPKRPPTAFFIFLDDFRKQYKVANPDSKNVSAVAKEGGVKWKSMSEEEKKPYLDKAAELKAEYVKASENLTAGIEDDEKALEEEGTEQ